MARKSRFVLLVQRLLLLLAIYSFCRILFYAFNFEYYQDVPFLRILKLFFIALRFDIVAIVISNLAFIGLHYYPFRHFYHRFYQAALRFLFLLVNSAAVMLNLIDIEFIRFEGKRATTDAFRVMGFGDDFINTAPRIVLDYWYVLLIFILVVFGMNKLYSRIRMHTEKPLRGFLFTTTSGQILTGVLLFGLVFIGFRGGIQYRPVNIMTASRYASGKEVSLLLNTPFTMLKTIGKNVLRPVQFLPDNEAQQISPVIHQFNKQVPFRNQNVILVILESLGKEYMGAFSNKEGYTPFLDSLMNYSLVFTDAYANGKRSIEGIPCIIAGIPALMDEPFITSAYNGNKITSLANTLGKKGYKSYFFHGGTNGTMGFDNFSKLAGYDAYFGRREYNNDADFDGNWGIFDEPYLQYSVRELSRLPQPFHATVFTLSSHHPYKVPEKYEGKFRKGPLPIHESIMYTDYALQQFFKSAMTTDWYDSTLFIITSDHTAISNESFYQTAVGMYAIPVLFYHPHDSLKGRLNITTEQIDIIPAVLDYLNYDLPFFSLGSTPFGPAPRGSAISFINGIYQLIQNDHVLSMDTMHVRGFYNFRKDSLLRNNIQDSDPERQRKMEHLLKSQIQNYNQSMLNNTMSVQ